ncbi:MAG: MiaB/RimO family radical SAM methylthiotransferase [Candidatus Moranbacteria bacterium]|nr:MiaB/RimO family radical SAM methylthiotransferase [Candidatus Moranbacteria bacterium]
MMAYFFKIFGCQMNYSDAERIATMLEKYKMKKASSVDEADFVVFVTCGVRQSAEDRVYGQVNNIRKKFPEKKIIVTGCLAHRKDVQRRLKDKAGLFCAIKDFPKEIIKILDTEYKIQDTKNLPCTNYLKITPKYANSHTAYVPVMTGCDNFCAYCVVPYARGREHSRPAENILDEVKSLVEKGYKEIVLLGQNVNSYNSKIQISNIQYPIKFQNIKSKIHNAPYSTVNTKKDTMTFADLLKQIDSIPGKFWLTFLTSHPKDMSDELIETIAKSKKICEYISLPAQSGDDEVLRRMNRKYTVEHYKKLIRKIRRDFRRLNFRKPKVDPSISTDIIVGFPGETKKQFENTAKLMREMKYDMAYIAQYSPRPETAALKMKDNVSKKEKARREKVLTEILGKTALANNKKYVGKTVEILVTSSQPSPYKGEGDRLPLLSKKRTRVRFKYSGHTRAQKKIIFFSNKKIPVGSFQKVKITKAKTFGLEGEIK